MLGKLSKRIHFLFDKLGTEVVSQVGGLTVLMSLLGYRHVSPAVKLQKTLKESLEQP